MPGASALSAVPILRPRSTETVTCIADLPNSLFRKIASGWNTSSTEGPEIPLADRDTDGVIVKSQSNSPSAVREQAWERSRGIDTNHARPDESGWLQAIVLPLTNLFPTESGIGHTNPFIPDTLMSITDW